MPTKAACLTCVQTRYVNAPAERLTPLYIYKRRELDYVVGYTLVREVLVCVYNVYLLGTRTTYAL